MEARIIKTKGKDIVEDISVNFDKTDYEILNSVYARNKKGQRLISFLYSFDYSKENDADAGTIGASIKQIE